MQVELELQNFVYIIALSVVLVVLKPTETEFSLAKFKPGGDLDSTWVMKPEVHAELQYSS